jgi:hypothetical protein
MTVLGSIFFGILAPITMSLVGRDAYNCLPALRSALLRLAAKQMPEHMRADSIEEWSAVIEDMVPSELFRTWVALDFVRAGFLIGRELKTAMPTSARQQASPYRADMARAFRTFAEFSEIIVQKVMQETADKYARRVASLIGVAATAAAGYLLIELYRYLQGPLLAFVRAIFKWPQLE